MKKTLLFSLVLAVITLGLTSCTKSSQLELAIKQANKECPMPSSDGMTVESITYEDGNVVYNFSIDENVVPTEAIKMLEENKEMLKGEMIKSIRSARDKNMSALVKLCKEADADIDFKFVGSKSKTSFTIEIDPEEF